MFNQINARVVDKDEINMVRTLLSNPIFWFIWLAEMVVQHIMLFWAATSDTGKAILGMTDIGFGLQAISVTIGLLSFVVHVIHVKYVPLDVFG